MWFYSIGDYWRSVPVWNSARLDVPDLEFILSMIFIFYLYIVFSKSFFALTFIVVIMVSSYIVYYDYKLFN